jgi:hypothetical protein
MPRHHFFAITLLGVVGAGSGANDNKCMLYCDRQVKACLIRVHDAARRW